LTVIGAVVFAFALVAWQQTLPTRVTSLPDAFANGVGALAGAALGHARKGVHVRFDV
jgi:VanZ family protein